MAIKTVETFRNWTRVSNYTGNVTLSKVQTHLQRDSPVPVNKRPGWRKLKRLQRNAPMSYSMSVHRANAGNLSLRRDEVIRLVPGPSATQYLYEDGPWDSSVGGPATIFTDCAVDADYKALNRLLSAMAGEHANLANVFAERKQTAELISTSIRRIANVMLDLRRGRVQSAIRRISGDPKTARKLRGKDIADQWIALQYGIKPVLQDIYDLATGLEKYETENPVVFIAKGKQYKVGKPLPYALTWARLDGGRRTDAIVRYMIRAWPDQNIRNLASFGFTNPLVPMWEVIPWSFVVDWVLPVGSWLSQLTADHGWEFHDGCKSTLVKSGEHVSANYLKSGTTPYPVDYTYSETGWMSGTIVKFDRELLSSFPRPKMPQFKNPFSIAHVENAIALLVQASGSKRGLP